jgi:hypothetical protein
MHRMNNPTARACSAGKDAGRWLWCGEQVPPAGVHRTAGQFVETTFKMHRFQYFDGQTWGAIALDAGSALALANTPSQFRPTFWLTTEEEFA